ncbi:hemagglutinin repeat-containing protein [Mannheimia pernigra]|uniref:Hemagglutinin repeat-containing protein n=1 Tax=Mannheimia pernigra TaxID=111844 RepID=A0ABD7A836_9PAST|nr:hemagglutinin repeat-containing protein [Mannheimia pernigra]QLB42333.1 hemagglutinin repeat-containing protein [Mannheimia pernigra]
MNKQCFRVIFSKTLQRVVVTSELAKSEGKSTEKSPSTFLQLFAHIRPLVFSLFCALGFVAFSDSALANLIIQADKSAPKSEQPIILQTANGLPQINIQTPNDKGLSHNKYSKFDVDTRGAILNNSHTHTQTQLAGYITGNPYLARGEAKVILNEVNSSDPSVLKGYVEVAGKKAEVIIANPSGLHCEGCGIIHSNRATFTTGKPQIVSGNLESFVVEKGKVSVSGKGMDNSRVDYTEILAREAEVNAGIWSKKETNVITGKNTIKRSENDKNLQIVHTKQPLAEEAKPQWAIDVGELGGMYSGKIHLIGTENGVGVRNAGHIGASADTLQIDSQGRIVNTGTLNAAKPMLLTASQGIENRGKMENRQGDITLNTLADIRQDGSIVARAGHIHKTAQQGITQHGETVAKGNITYKTPTLTASTRSLIAAGVDVQDSAQGEVRTLEHTSTQGKHISITTSGTTTLQGKNIASGKLNISSSDAHLDNSHTSAYSINVTASQGPIQANQSVVMARQDLTLTTPTALETQHSYLKAESIKTKQRSLNTQNATWEQTGTDELTLDVADTLQNNGGTFKTQGNLTIKANGLNNQQGRLLANGRLDIYAGKGKVDSSDGILLSNQNLTITSGELLNERGLIQSHHNIAIHTQEQALSNKQTLTDTQDKGIVARGTLDIRSANIANQQGRIVSGGKQHLNTADIDSQQGLIYTQQNLTLHSANIINSGGKIKANKHAEIALLGNLRQQNGVIEAEHINVTSQQIKSIDKSQIIADSIALNVANQLENLNSLIQANKQNIVISSQQLDNTGGEIASQQDAIMINTAKQKLTNKSGKLLAKSEITINSGEIDNTTGAIHSENNIVLNTHTQKLTNDNTLSPNKGIIALGNLTLNSGNVANQQGYIASQHHLKMNVLAVNNTQGLMKTNQGIQFIAQSVKNDRGIISAKSNANISIIGSLQQQTGKIGARELIINAGQLDSTQQSVITADNVTLAITRSLVNTNSEISATHHLNVKSQGLNNQQSLLLAEQGHLSINTQQQSMNNQQGKIVSGQTVSVESGALNNQQGVVQGKTGVNLNTHHHSINNTLATIISQQTLKIAAGELNNQQGYLQSAQQASIQLGSAALFNQQGVISSGSDLNLNAGTVRNNEGAIASKHNITATISNLYQKNGVVKAEQSLNVKVDGETYSTQQSQLSGKNVYITTAGNLDNQHAEIVAKQNAVIRSKQLNNRDAVLMAEQGDLKIDTQQHSLINQQGKLSAGANLTIQSSELNNQAGLIQSRQDMVINTHQGHLNNQQTKTDSQVPQIKGIISLGQLALNTQQLLNREGYVLSRNSQTINAQSIGNDAGVLASLASQKAIVSQHLSNVKGRMNAETTSISAQSVDNQSGLLQAHLSLNIDAKDTLNNQKGQIKANDRLEIKSHHLNNQTGNIGAIKGNVLLKMVEKINNIQGNITAKQATYILADGLNNQQGIVYNEQGLLHLDLQQHALDNQQGKIISQDSLKMEAGTITNYEGVIYAENQGKLQITGLINNKNNGKIHGLGEMAINANQLDNSDGEVRTKDKLTLNITKEINNQKVGSTGSLIESGNELTIHTEKLDNRHTQSSSEIMTQGVLASVLDISAKRVDNQQGQIHSRVRSRFNIQDVLNNQQGKITGEQDLAIKGEGLLVNNQDGRLQAVNFLSIFANEMTTNGHIEGRDILLTQQKDFVTGKHINAKNSLSITTLGNLTNQHDLYADESVTLNAYHIINGLDGRISSALTRLTAKGNVTNEGLINSIRLADNAKTLVKAGGHLLNIGNGRIYGDDVALQADIIENRDKDYGNEMIKSAVVAARGNLDIAGREIINDTAHYLSDNQVGSTLFSVGNMTFGRELNAKERAEGQADSLLNSSSLIESEGTIALNVKQIHNNNRHFEVEHVQQDGQPTEVTKLEDRRISETYIVPMHRDARGNLVEKFTNALNGDKSGINHHDPHIPMKLLRWAGWSRAGQLVYKSDGAEPVVLKASDVITPDTPLAIRNQVNCDYINGKESCSYTPAGQYGKDSPIWGYFGATPPTTPQPKFPFDDLTEQPWFVEREWFDEDGAFKRPSRPLRFSSSKRYRAQKVKWSYYVEHIKPLEDWERENADSINKVDAGIEKHNRNRLGDLANKYYRDFWQLHINNHRVDESKVTKTVAGQILAGGELKSNSQSFTNARSTVMSGKAMLLENDIKNIGEEGLHRITDTGEKVFTFDKWRGGLKRYFQRKWENYGTYKRIIDTPFDMDVYRVEENVNFNAHKQASEGLKLGTNHRLSLTEIKVEGGKELIGVGKQAFGELESQANIAFTPLTLSSNHNVNTAQVWSGEKQPIHSQDLAGEIGFLSSKKPNTRQLERISLANNVEVRSIQPNLAIPQNVLYRLNPEPSSRVLIETDPHFTDKKRWLSSDYMFNALRYEPNQMQKRIGDGFYEQRLIREQINRLTGRQFVGNYTDFDTQYRHLMDAGVTFAQKFNLRPGITLSPSQVAKLTTDIVWFENQSVQLPNGKVETVLVPKVYAMAKKGDITGNATLLSGNKITHKGGEFINSGTVAGRELVQFDSNSIRNSGTIQAGAITGNISGKVENIGGTIEADRAILLNIAGNFTHRSATHTTKVNEADYQRTDTTIARKGLLHVKGKDGRLQINTNNIDISGADVINDGQGSTYLSAKNLLNLTALQVGFNEKMGGGNHYRNESVNDVVVSNIRGNGNVTLVARDIYSEGADLAAKEKLIALAENDIMLGSATRSSDYAEYHRIKSSGAFGSSKKTSLDTDQQTLKVGTKLGGGEIILSAGNNVEAHNLQAIADNDLIIQGGNNVTIGSDINRFKTTHFEEKSKSGVFSGSGIGITFGKKSETHEHEIEGWQGSAARSTLGSLNGNITVSAGNHAQLAGVDAIVSKELGKQILVEGKSTYIGASKDTLSSKERHEQKQSGLSITFSSAVTDGVMAVRQALNRAEKVQDERLSNVLKVKAANEAYETLQHATKVIDALKSNGDSVEKQANSEAKISVSIGSNQSVSTSHTQQTTHKGSELNAGKAIVRTTEGDNIIVGSIINATHTELEGNNVNLLGTTNSQTNRSDNKSNRWNVGFFVGKSQGATGFGVEGAVNVGKGHSNSDSTVQNQTEINSDSLKIKAKETTTLKGAVANVKHLSLDTKNLHIESVQDTEKYDSKQTQGGVSGSVAIYGSGWGLSSQASQNKAKVNYAQVNQQSGFNIQENANINVQENTHIKGGMINAQGDKANHQMTTSTLTTEEIENRSDVKVSSVSVSMSSEMSKIATSAMGAALSALGNMSESERSQTKAAISDNINLTITDSEAQKQKTGKTAQEILQSLNRDTENANQAVKKADLSAIQEKQETAQVIGELSQSWTNRLVQPHLEEANKKRQEAEKIEKSDPLKSAQLKAEAQAIEAEYGLGSNLQMGIRAATAALQRLATGNANQAAVGLLSPYANKLIKEQTGDNTEANLIAHTVLGAVEAHITGNNATAGALGAFTAEAAAPYLIQALYNTDNAENLTDSQKQNIANLSQIAAGLASGVTGDSTADFISGAEIGKRAVENNYLSADKAKERFEIENRIKLGIATEVDLARKQVLDTEDIANDQKVITACKSDITSNGCQNAVAEALVIQQGYHKGYPNETWRNYSNILVSDYHKFNELLYDKTGVALDFEQRAKLVAKGKGISVEEARDLVISLDRFHMVLGATGYPAGKIVSTKISSLTDARKNMASLVNTQRAKHMLYGDETGGGHKFGLMRIFNEKSKFPVHWGEKKILDAVSNVATDPSLKWIQQTGTQGSLYTKKGVPSRFKVEGYIDGVKIRVIVEPAGEGIITAFPIK